MIPKAFIFRQLLVFLTMHAKATLTGIALILILFSCNRSSKINPNDPRFNSGQKFETGEPIKPKTFHFGDHSFVLGYSEHAATLGMFKGHKEILFLTSPDGSFDSVAVTELNGDGADDYLVYELFEDGLTIHSLTSVSRDSFRYEIVSEEIVE